MSDCPSEPELEAYASGTLPAQALARVTAHLGGCERCRRSLAAGLHQTTPSARPLHDEGRRATELEVEASPDGLGDTHVSDERPDPLGRQPLPQGTQLNRYVLLNRLGSGGMGDVYAAWDPVLDRKVALKLLRADFRDSPRTEELRSRLLREAQALARLSHRNVVAVHDVGTHDEQIYVAMEFLEGQTLSRWLSEKDRSWREVLEVFLEAGEGLVAAHESGLTHRDFKPDNVVVRADGRVVVMDFGLAHLAVAEAERDLSPSVPVTPLTPAPSATIKRRITQPGVMLGTPAYMSPEAMYGQTTDFRSDEFSFCVALYEALYGYRPFLGDTAGAIAVEISANRVRPPPRETPVPKRLHQLLLKGLSADPQQRFQTLGSLLVQLGRRTSSRRRQYLAVGVVALAVLSISIVTAVVHRERQRCAGVAHRLDGVWDERIRASAREAFAGTERPWAAAAWREVEHALDQYANRWVQLRTQACEARASERDEALGQNLVCLSRRLADLDAAAQLFSHADAEIVERAVATASALPALDGCIGAPGTPRRPQLETDEARLSLSWVKARLEAGKNGEAAEQAQALMAQSEQAGDLDAYAQAALLLGMARGRQGTPGTADEPLEAAIVTAESISDDELVARAWVERLGYAVLAQAPVAETERWSRHARAAVARVGHPAELEASLDNNLGALASSRGQYEQALTWFRQALALRTEAFGAEHPVVARMHSNLGSVLKALDRRPEAVDEYRKALAIEERRLDPSHPAVGETLNNLGNALADPLEAQAAFERALAIKSQAYGALSLPVASTLTNLGVALLHADLPASEAALRRSLAMKEQLAGPDSPTVALTLTNLARALRLEGRWGDALELDRRAAIIRKARFGPTWKDLAFNLTGEAWAHLKLEHPADARKAAEEALALRTTTDDDRAETQLVLAHALAAMKEREQATALVGEVLLTLSPASALRGDAAELQRQLTTGPAATPHAPARRGSSR